MKKLTKVALPLVVMTFGYLSATVSYAGDAKLYPGSMCVPNKSEISKVTNGAILNTSNTEWLFINCPIVKDEIRSHINNGHVNVLDNHYNLNINCTLSSKYTNNGFWHWLETKKSIGSSIKAQKLSFGGLGANPNSYYYIGCHIPPRYSGKPSGVTLYYANEK